MLPNQPLNPYKLNFDPENGFYSFITGHGITYNCAFNPVDLAYEIEINDFQFQPTEKPKNDPRVPVTVAEVLKGYFTSPGKVLMYICDPADGKWQARQRLFRQWHENMGSDFVYRRDLLISIGENEARGGVMVRKDFPYEDYPDMIDKVRGIVFEKF